MCYWYVHIILPCTFDACSHRPGDVKNVVDGLNYHERILLLDMMNKIQLDEVQEDNNRNSDHSLTAYGSIILAKECYILYMIFTESI